MNIEEPTNKKSSLQRFDRASTWLSKENNKAITYFLRENVHIVTFNTIWFCFLVDPFFQSTLMVMTRKLTYRYAFTLLKMKKAEGRSEYIDLAKEANLLWHQIVSQKSKNAPQIDSRT